MTEQVTQDDLEALAQVERKSVDYLTGMIKRLNEWETKEAHLMRHRNYCLIADIQKETKGKYLALLKAYTNRNQRFETLEELVALHEELNDFHTLVQSSKTCVC